MLKTYLATLTFISGEYEQTFHKIFKAENTRSAGRDIHKYFASYYPNAKKEKENVYSYFGFEVAIEIENYEEIKDPQQVVDRLTV